MKLEYNNPALEKGMDLDIPGIGLVENGGSIEVSDEQAAAYENITGVSLTDAAKDNEMMSLSGTGSRSTVKETKEEKKEDEGGGS